MKMETKKMRSSIEDLRREQERLRTGATDVKAAAQKLAADRKELDKLGGIVESLDMPAEDKVKITSSLEQQGEILEKKVETDVDKPTVEIDKQQEQLAKESERYAEGAKINKEKLDNFRPVSEMDSSPIKQAATDQASRENNYRNLQKEIEEDRRNQKRDIQDLRSQAVR
jgi:hypothetical protein